MGDLIRLRSPKDPPARCNPKRRNQSYVNSAPPACPERRDSERVQRVSQSIPKTHCHLPAPLNVTPRSAMGQLSLRKRGLLLAGSRLGGKRPDGEGPAAMISWISVCSSTF